MSLRTKLRPPRTFLGVEKRLGYISLPVSEVETENQIDAGIGARVHGGMISPFEEHSARIECQYTLEQWYLLPPYERALNVATIRMKRAIEAHYADAQAKAAKKKR